jgi:hypothetical protein
MIKDSAASRGRKQSAPAGVPLLGRPPGLTESPSSNADYGFGGGGLVSELGVDDVSAGGVVDVSGGGVAVPGSVVLGVAVLSAGGVAD